MFLLNMNYHELNMNYHELFLLTGNGTKRL